MGAHGTLEEALASVSSFAEADARNERSLVKKAKKDGGKSDAKKASKKAHNKERHRDSKKVRLS